MVESDGDQRELWLLEQAQPMMSRKSMVILFASVSITMPVWAQTSDSVRRGEGDIELSRLNEDFAKDSKLHDVRVEIVDGFIHIRGSVDVLEDAREAFRRVDQKHLSSSVISHIVVRATKVSDSSLRLQLTEKLSPFYFDSIQVRVRHGVVRVSGNVPERDQRDRILSIVCSTPGVRGIDDLIEVGGK
jgi:osmotically-inducible protein OsmY